MSSTRDELIAWYFSLNYSYSLILCFLHFVHGFTLSLRQLKRHLKRLSLRRRQPVNTHLLDRTLDAMQTELRSSASLLGYRSLWRRLKFHHNLPVTRYTVMRLLSYISPSESRQRKKGCLQRRMYDCKGPNFVWHADGMDKLKPYGFAIHGCIDGYSRKVLWLQVGTSNNNPRVVAWHYLQCVKQLKGVPRLLRTDCGSENTNLSFMQPFLRRAHVDCFSGMDSFRYGKSVTNQRIEAWWSQLNKHCTRFWRALFKGLELNGLLNITNVIHMDCLRFCFMHLIQEDLFKMAFEWNTHKIRLSRNSAVPNGHPDELFSLPQLQGVQNYLCGVTSSDLAICDEHCEAPEPPGTLEFLVMARCLMSAYSLRFPKTLKEAIYVYVTMTSLVEVRS